MKTNSGRDRLIFSGAFIIVQLTLCLTLRAQSIESVSKREVQRRQAALPKGAAALARAQAAMQARNYVLAHEEFRNALNLLPDAVTSAKAHDEALTGFCESGVKVAEQDIAEGRFEAAESVLREVLEDRYDPNCRPALDLLAHLQQPGYFNKTMGPKFTEKVEEVKQLLAGADGYYNSGRYDLAFKKYEQVLAIDPYNTAARHGEEKIDNTKYDYNREAYNETRARAVWQVEKAWEQPVRRYGVTSSEVFGPAAGNVNDTARIASKLNSIIIPRIEFRDASIREAIDFLHEQAAANDQTPDGPKGVNIVLRPRRLGEIAPAPPAAAPPLPGGSGNPPTEGPAASPAPARPTIESASATGPEAARITITLSQIPLGEALRYIANQAGLKVKVEPHAVLLVPVSEQSAELITKRYRVPPEFFGGPLDVGYYLEAGLAGGQNAGQGRDTQPAPVAEKILEQESVSFQASTGIGTGAGAASTTNAVQGTATTRQHLLNDRQLVGRADAKTMLQAMGVPFPVYPPGCGQGGKPEPCIDAASATFFPHSGTLVVRNTVDNLDMVDALVEQANASGPKQVEIEAKFVEINQNNLKELGFDWLLGQFNVGNHKLFAGGGTSGTGESINPADWPFTPPGSTNPVGQFPVTAGNRSGTLAISGNAIDALLAGTTGGASQVLAPGIFGLSGVFTDPQFQVVIRALNQKKGIDLLSAPRVTTKSGQRAIIEIVREFRYPTKFTEPKVPDITGRGTSSNANTTTVALPVVGPSTPTDFDTRNTGVTLEVEPVVGADGTTIDLNLVPQVVEFEGFINYGSPIKTVNPALLNFITGATSSLTGLTQAITLTDNIINQPIFSTRKVTTSVQIADGQTVVLGGLMREDVQKVEDRTPFLGDIPFVGRLFRSNVDQHIKRNLIIFVTAKRVTPFGQPVEEEEEELQAPVLPEMPAYKK